MRLSNEHDANRVHALYYAAIDADKAFDAELRRVYGNKLACNARYFTMHHDAALNAAKAAKLAADAAYLEACHA